MRDGEFQTEEVELEHEEDIKKLSVDRVLLAQYPFFQSYFKCYVTKQRGKSLVLPIFSCSLINFIQVCINWQLSLEDINSVSEALVLDSVYARPYHLPAGRSVTASSLCECWFPIL